LIAVQYCYSFYVALAHMQYLKDNVEQELYIMCNSCSY